MKKIDARTGHEAEPGLRDDLSDPSAILDIADADDPRAARRLGAARGVMIAIAVSAVLWIAIACFAF